MPALTSLRFFAALGVVLFHMEFLKQSTYLSGVYDAVFSHGHLGVPFFFVLSGFILTYNFAPRFHRLERVRLRSYFVARLARVYPLHLFALICFLLVQGSSSGPDWNIGSLVANATLTQAWVPDESYYMGFNAQTWSLSVEAFFYLVFPFAAWALLRVRTTTASLLSLASALWAIHLFAIVLSRGTFASGENPELARWLYGSFPPFRLFEFLLGMTCARLLTTDPVAKERSRGWWTAAEIAAIALVLTTVCLRAEIVARWNYRTLAGLGYPAFCVLLFVFAHGKGALSRRLAHPAMVFLGEASYALFLIHGLVLFALPAHLAFLRERPELLALVAFGSLLILSIFCHALIEIPARRWIIRRLSPKSAPLDAPAAPNGLQRAA